MKTAKFLCGIIFAIVLLNPGFSNAQKASEKVTTKVTLIDDLGQEHTFSGEGNEVFSKNGNILRTVHIKVPKDILEYFVFEPYANIWIVGTFGFDTDGDGIDDLELVDSRAFLNKSGNLSVSFHFNGAGRIIPKGY